MMMIDGACYLAGSRVTTRLLSFDTHCGGTYRLMAIRCRFFLAFYCDCVDFRSFWQ
jgi:hypothetical protein